MGSPKALIPYRGKTFLEHLLEVARHPQISPILVVLGPHADPIRKASGAGPANVVINQDWQKGQLSSIQAAVQPPDGHEETDGFMLFLVDHPFISAALVDQLVGVLSLGKADCAADVSGQARASGDFRAPAV